MFQPGTVLNDRYQILRSLGQGGFSHTYEVEDLKREKSSTRLVLKILLDDYPKAVDLFRREAKVLSLLDHPGIPRVDPDSYFTLRLEGQPQQLHCLVMERIPGINLRQWMSSRRFVPIGTAKAIDWLFQMVDILAKIHQCQCFHRDIKPSNIILRPNGRLALIDFGAVREVTQTYLRQHDEDGTHTHIYSRGYTPTEQMQGRAVPASDFFALGRTFVHLMTGCNPLEFPIDSHSGQLIWQHKAPQIIPSLAELVNRLMAPTVARRPRNIRDIYQALTEICREIETGQIAADADAHKKTVIYNLVLGEADRTLNEEWEQEKASRSLEQISAVPDLEADLTQLPPEYVTTSSLRKETSRNKNPADSQQQEILQFLTRNRLRPSLRWLLRRPALATLLWTCLVISGISLLRLSGLLQGTELTALDMFMRSRPKEALDPRLLLITIDESDLDYQTQTNMPRQGSSLSDMALHRLLEKIYPHNPSAIGIDIYRVEVSSSESTSSESTSRDEYPENLADQSYLKQYDELFVVCSNAPGIPPPLAIPIERVGFVDMPLDPDRLIRRQILGMAPSEDCQTDKSLSYQLAATYLAQKDIDARLVDQTLYFGDRPIPALFDRRGAYYGFRMGGYEIPINYRKSQSIGQRVSLEEILSGQLDDQLEDLVRDRLILIGTTAMSYKDYHDTPYGSLSGVEIHAHMTSQLISFMLDDRPLIKPWPVWGEILWMMSWTSASASLVLLGRSPRQRWGSMGLLVIAMVGSSSILFFFFGLWVPLIPTGAAMAIAYGGLHYAKSRLKFWVY